MWMPSEPCWPRIILAYIRGRAVKRAPQSAILNMPLAAPIIKPFYRYSNRHRRSRPPNIADFSSPVDSTNARKAPRCTLRLKG